MLNETEKAIHLAALRCSKLDNSNQTELVSLVIKAERIRYYRKLGWRTLNDYILNELGIDSTFTFQLRRVVEAAVRFEPLRKALENGRLRVGHASRILAKLDEANVKDWVEYASTHTFSEVTERVACSNPFKSTRESKKRLSNAQTRLSLVVDDLLLAQIERVQALIAQKGKPSKLVDAVGELCSEYLTRHDPVQKAQRQKAKSDQTAEPIQKNQKANGVKKVTLRKIVYTRNRVPLTAAQKHAVFLRTGGRCTFTDHRGRCGVDRHVHIHHIKPVAEGCSNDPSNLTVVCSFHHDWIHQTSFPGLEQPWWLTETEVSGAPEKTRSA